MRKQDLLVLGCGGAGNRMVNQLVKLDKRYVDFYVNTNLAEMEKLDTYDERKVFYIPNADGTGKDKALAEKYIQQEVTKFADTIVKFKEVKHVVIFTSINGGTGGTATLMLSRVIKKLLNVTISVMGAFPRLDESKIDFQNALEFWADLTKYREKNIIQSFTFIDNNKSNNFEIINKKVAKNFNAIFDVVSDNIDSSDLRYYFTEKGYSIPLLLDESIEDVEEAISKALKNSPFYVPNIETASVLIGNVNTDAHEISDLTETIPNTQFKKTATKTIGNSTVVLAGCTIPSEAIEIVNESLKELNNSSKSKVEQEDINFTIVKEKKEKEVKRTSSVVNKDELSALNDDSFWEW